MILNEPDELLGLNELDETLNGLKRLGRNFEWP